MKNNNLLKLNLSKDLIKKFQKLKINNSDELLKACKRYIDRDNLSKKLNISKKELFEIVNKLDFLRLKSITVELAELFSELNFKSLNSIKKIDSNNLELFLKNNNVSNLKIPNKKVLEKIISEANNSSPKIFCHDKVTLNILEKPKIKNKTKKSIQTTTNIDLFSKIKKYKKILLFLIIFISILLLFIFLLYKYIYLATFLPLLLGFYFRFIFDPFKKKKSLKEKTIEKKENLKNKVKPKFRNETQFFRKIKKGYTS